MRRGDLTRKLILLAEMLYCLPTGPNNEVHHVYLQNKSICICKINLITCYLPSSEILVEKHTQPQYRRTVLGTNVLNVHNLYKTPKIPECKSPGENHPILNEQRGHVLNGKSQYNNMFIDVMQFQWKSKYFYYKTKIIKPGVGTRKDRWVEQTKNFRNRT